MKRIALAAFALALSTAPLCATPARIIILRHGEKQDTYALCQTGIDRSLALTERYLGKGAKDSLFASGGDPAAFFAITLHTLETVSPSAQTWGLPVSQFSVVPIKGNALGNSETVENARTRQAAAAVLSNPAWNGKTVVMVWEHKHIANEKLEAAYPGEKVTLRQLLNLDTLGKQVPKSWEGGNYDYVWIVTYGNPGSQNPTAFEAVKQKFEGQYASLPDNDWGQPENLPSGSGCKA